MKWFATAPANIALIKYMGKKDSEQNIPANNSLSYTLPELLSYAELELVQATHDAWEPLDIPGGVSFDLPPVARQRYLDHLHWLKRQFDYKGHFIVRSCNNFPMASGLASSASSFAALTTATMRAICELTEREELNPEALAELSRQGSGSSCRSFFQPWALWTPQKISEVELPYPHLLHHAILINKNVKAVSSRLAHERVKTSHLYADRPSRANQNLTELLRALSEQNWKLSYDIVWRDFNDMHQLFETANPPFSYRTDESRWVLNEISEHWEKEGDGPLVTMDAGPNIHLLFRPDQEALAKKMRFEFLRNFDVL